MWTLRVTASFIFYQISWQSLWTENLRSLSRLLFHQLMILCHLICIISFMNCFPYLMYFEADLLTARINTRFRHFPEIICNSSNFYVNSTILTQLFQFRESFFMLKEFQFCYYYYGISDRFDCFLSPCRFNTSIPPLIQPK